MNIAQVRYYSDNDKNNYNPSGQVINKTYLSTLSANNIFYKYIGDKGSIQQLGIQALPGTKFYINGDGTTNVYPVMIGSTGIFEIDLNDGMQIKSLRFDRQSLVLIENNDAASLIVDFLYIKNNEEDEN